MHETMKRRTHRNAESPDNYSSSSAEDVDDLRRAAGSRCTNGRRRQYRAGLPRDTPCDGYRALPLYPLEYGSSTDKDSGTRQRYRYGHRTARTEEGENSRRQQEATDIGIDVSVRDQLSREYRNRDNTREYPPTTRARRTESYYNKRRTDCAEPEKQGGDHRNEGHGRRSRARPLNYIKPGKFDGTASIYIYTFLIQLETT